MITIMWDAGRWCSRNSCERRYSVFLLAHSYCKQLDTTKSGSAK